jgi:hypothetical protein
LALLGGIKRGITDLSRGIATGSRGWPQAFAQNRQLELQRDRMAQQQQQFEEQESRQFDEFNAREDRLKKQQDSQRLMQLLQSQEPYLDMAQMFAETGDVDQAGRIFRQYLDTHSQIEAMLLKNANIGTMNGESVTLGQAVHRSVTTGLPGLATDQTEEGFGPETADPTLQLEGPVNGSLRQAKLPDEQQEDLGGRWLASIQGERYRKGIELLLEIAEKNPILAKQMFDMAFRDLSEEEKTKAYAKFDLAGAPTEDERLKLVEAAWQNAKDDVYKEDALAKDVWNEYKLYAQTQGVDYDGDKELKDIAAARLNILLQGDAQVTFSEGIASRIVRGLTLKRSVQTALLQLTDPKLAEKFGGLEGVSSALENRFPTAWNIMSSGDKEETLKTIRGSKELRDIINLLDSSGDLYGRMQSGATLNEYEQHFYRRIVGSIGQPAHLIRTNLQGIIRVVDAFEESAYESAYKQKRGNREHSDAILYGDKDGLLNGLDRANDLMNQSDKQDDRVPWRGVPFLPTEKE